MGGIEGLTEKVIKKEDIVEILRKRLGEDETKRIMRELQVYNGILLPCPIGEMYFTIEIRPGETPRICSPEFKALNPGFVLKVAKEFKDKKAFGSRAEAEEYARGHK